MKQEPIILGKNTRFPLKGILTLPEGSGPFPAVVLVHGSGSSNMDEKVGKLTPFKDIALGLAQRGIASVRYDKRSYVHGLKMVLDKGRPITVWEETIEDALLAGTPRRLEEVLLEQTREAMADMSGFTRKIASKQLKKLEKTFDGLYDLPDEAAKAKKVGGGTTLYYFKEMGRPTVADWLAKTHKPMLIMQGEQDFQVKASVDFAMYKELLGDRENVTFKLYPGLNHAFVPARFDSIAQAKKEFTPQRHIGPEVLDDIADWIKGQV